MEPPYKCSSFYYLCRSNERFSACMHLPSGGLLSLYQLAAADIIPRYWLCGLFPCRCGRFSLSPGSFFPLSAVRFPCLIHSASGYAYTEAMLIQWGYVVGTPGDRWNKKPVANMGTGGVCYITQPGEARWNNQSCLSEPGY
jgi:hypothetical protein